MVPHFDAHSKQGEAMIAVATLGIAGLAAVSLGALARARLGNGEQAVVPAGRFSIRGFFEMITELVSGLANTVIGEHGRAYVPMFAAVFFFVLLNNLIGVIPGMTPATENLNTTLAFGLFMFLAYNFLGIKENGFVNYMKHFLGPVLWLAPFMFVIEIISHLVRPVSLGLRLANVLMGDHKVLGMFLDMVPAIVPIPFYVMGLFVCVLQAFVFTLLSMVYVALATAHDH
ncbi:MAG: F0F1 ATP synthase subunit A [Bdellovibrionaceae bacterium]|nr:F0F1 ATP synthase subunit A [Pseudobdellovibrionaceae bacterium]MBX3033663.1 F0F1 ATP synthase subunit A [Pseudobdellovibrionaceae bacterium]